MLLSFRRIEDREDVLRRRVGEDVEITSINLCEWLDNKDIDIASDGSHISPRLGSPSLELFKTLVSPSVISSYAGTASASTSTVSSSSESADVSVNVEAAVVVTPLVSQSAQFSVTAEDRALPVPAAVSKPLEKPQWPWYYMVATLVFAACMFLALAWLVPFLEFLRSITTTKRVAPTDLTILHKATVVIQSIESSANLNATQMSINALPATYMDRPMEYAKTLDIGPVFSIDSTAQGALSSGALTRSGVRRGLFKGHADAPPSESDPHTHTGPHAMATTRGWGLLTLRREFLRRSVHLLRSLWSRIFRRQR
jgi:hypothetical protein